jgi:cytochrome c oxidase subunit 3/cytochrome c oxidase subunit I+III
VSTVPRRLALANGWWGMTAFVATEAAVFGSLLASYFFLRSKAPAWPPDGIDPPKLLLPLVLTGVLVATSLPMHLASSLALRDRVGSARLALLLALVTQVGYLAVQARLYTEDLAKFTPQESAYGSIYYTLVGAHHAHVFLGILLTLWLVLRLLTGLTRYRVTAVQAIAFYWHFVNALAVAVLLTQISPSL